MIILSINYVFINTNGYRMLNFTDKYLHVGDNLEVVNLGSSHGMYGLKYDEYDVNGYNLGIYAQGVYYDYRLLQHFSPKIAKGAKIIIPISYFTPYQAIEGEKFDTYNTRYYRFLHPEYIKDFSLGDYLRYRLLPVAYAGENIEYLFNDKESIVEEWEFEEKNRYDSVGIIEEGKKRAEHHINTIIDVGKDNIHINIQAIEDIVKFCKEKGYEPIFITTPFHEEYNKHFSEEFYNQFNEIVNGLSEEFGVKYLDYSRDKRFSTQADYFVDSDHMSLTGRREFTNVLFKDLEIIE